MSNSPILGIALLEASQSQPEVPVNTAIRRLEAVLQLTVIARDVTAPPGGEADGDRYIVPAAATGAWANHGQDIAIFAGTAYLFETPRVGWLAYVAAEDIYVKFVPGSPSGWEELSLGGGGGGGGGVASLLPTIVTFSAGTNENNVAPTGWSARGEFWVLRVTVASGGSNWTGLDAGTAVDGEQGIITNQSAADDIVLQNNGGGSTAANRFQGPGGNDIGIEIKGAVRIMYDASLSRWRTA